jgi:hypothetical protein
VKPVRSLADDVKWALAVLAGFAIGALIFGADWSVVAGAAVGVLVVMLVRAVIRRRQRA